MNPQGDKMESSCGRCRALDLALAESQAEVKELKELLKTKGYLDQVWKQNDEIKQLHSHLAIAKEALRTITEHQKGHPGSTVFKKDIVIHGGFEHSDTPEQNSACCVCSALESIKEEAK